MIIKRTQNDKQATNILISLKGNDFYCPCKINKDQYNKCMCYEFLNMETSGYCQCGLYYKEVE